MERQATESDILHILWLEGASCDGCTMAMLGATDPSLDDLLLGRVPELPELKLVHPALSLESGDAFRAYLERAAEGDLAPFILVLEGSVFDETLAGTGSFSRLGSQGDQPQTTATWIDRLSREAEAVIAIGSCATWGGIPAAMGNPTGSMGLEDYLGGDFTSRSGLPVINVPGCAPTGDAFIDTVIYTYFHLAQLVPLELDEENRPHWLYGEPAYPMPAHSDYLPESARSVEGKPAVGCPVPTGGWMSGMGGCAEVGGSCIGCTARDFVDQYLPLTRLQESQQS